MADNTLEATKEKLTLSWRMGMPVWETDEPFATVSAILKEHHSVVDEIALFETITHQLYIPLDEYANRMKLAAERLEAFRQMGIVSVGINVLSTIGHINEAWSCMPKLPFQAMIGHDGEASLGCACPNTPEYREYIRAKYKLVAQANPDFIWVDDDIRMHCHTVAWGCFCPTCLAIFAKNAGRQFSREELVKAFNSPDERHLRRWWIEQNIETIESLLADVKAAIHEVNPKIKTGLMTAGPGWTTYSGVAFDRWFKALDAVKARPGGGFYSDATPIAMYHKAIECGFQRAILPSTTTDVQYELENFPYQRLQKSATTLVNECTMALAYGLNGIAFNIFATPTSVEDFKPWIDAVPSARPLWEKIVAHAADMPTVGLWPAWNSQLFALRDVKPGETWLDSPMEYNFNRTKILGEIGLPLACDTPSCGTLLHGRIAEAFSNDELKQMLSGGVIMDTTALEVLSERGLANLAGVKIARRFDSGMMERFTNDELNGNTAGYLRDARMELLGYGKGANDILELTADGVRTLSILEDYFHCPQGPAMTAFENELGGRVVVMGYAQWIYFYSVAKRMQLQNVADWITRGNLPIRIEQPVPLIPIVRQSADRKKAVILLTNAGLDTIKEATVKLRSSATRACLLEIGQKDRILELAPEESEKRIILRDLKPWSMRVILLDS